MNLNDFVVLPNSKAISVRLNARDLRELQMETVNLTQQNHDMEEKLWQLKQSMSKEKEERGHSGGFRWKSGQGASNISNGLTHNSKRDKETRLQKLSAGKLKIRMLKDKPLTVPSQPPPQTTNGYQATRKTKLRGTHCGQCEVKPAGIKCAECTENFCISCFVKFHQKGALKLHRMVPIKAELQTLVSTKDVFGDQLNTNSKPSHKHTSVSNTRARPGEQRPEKSEVSVARTQQLHLHRSQILDCSEEQDFEPELKHEVQKTFPTSLLSGAFNESESANYFQEALRQWRGETTDGAGDPMDDATWIPVGPALVSAIGTQADLSVGGQAEGGGRGKILIKAEFAQNSLSYMDRLLLKKHRRTPIELYKPTLTTGKALESLPEENTEEEEEGMFLTAQEEDFRRYYASLFAVPVNNRSTEARIITPEPCLAMEDQAKADTDIHGRSAQQTTTSDNNRTVALFEQDSSNKKTAVPHMASTSVGSSRVSTASHSPSPASSQDRATIQYKTADKLHPSEPTAVKSAQSMQSMPSARPTAETPRTLQTSIKTPTSKPQKLMRSSSVQKLNSTHASQPSSPHSQNKIPEVSSSPLSFLPKMSPVDTTRSPLCEDRPSRFPSTAPSLRSTFTVSASSSAESPLLPRVYSSSRSGSDSSLPPEQSQSSNIFPEPISSPRCSQSPAGHLESPEQFQHRSCASESLLSDYRLHLSPSLRPNSQPGALKSSTSTFGANVKSPSSISLFKESPLDTHFRYKSSPAHEDLPHFTSSFSISGSHESSLSNRETERVPSLSSLHLNVNRNRSSAANVEDEQELLMDSGDEMSCDSLAMTLRGEASSDEEAETHEHFTRGRHGEEERRSATSHFGDPFVAADDEIVKDLHTDEPEQLSEPSAVIHRWSDRPGSAQSWDVEGLFPGSLELSPGQSGTRESAQYDTLQTRQTSPQHSDSKDFLLSGSGARRPYSSFSACAETYMDFSIFSMADSTEPSEIKMCSFATFSRGEMSANELGKYAPNWISKSGLAVTRSPSPPSEPVLPSSSPSPSSPFPSTCLSRATLGSDMSPKFRAVSRAAQEIMEICSIDQMGCEDPDFDDDTTVDHLNSLEQELRLVNNGTSLSGAAKSGSQAHHRNPQTLFRVTREENEAEEATQSDRQSVLLLP